MIDAIAPMVPELSQMLPLVSEDAMGGMKLFTAAGTNGTFRGRKQTDGLSAGSRSKTFASAPDFCGRSGISMPCAAAATKCFNPWEQCGAMAYRFEYQGASA